MRLIIFIILGFVNSVCFAQTLNCTDITHRVTQAICTASNFQVYVKQLDHLEASIMVSKVIPEKDKQLFLQEQVRWVRYVNSICEKEVYCHNAEMVRRINDLIIYTASFNRHK